jgi:hypothetical protein
MQQHRAGTGLACCPRVCCPRDHCVVETKLAALRMLSYRVGVPRIPSHLWASYCVCQSRPSLFRWPA